MSRFLGRKTNLIKHRQQKQQSILLPKRIHKFMMYIDNILFAIILIAGIGFFAQNVKKLKRNISLGHDVNRSDNPSARWKNMAMIALGQSKMVKRPVAGFLHIIVYAGFIIINLEVLEIIIDGILGTHRVFSFLGGF